jgi:hypothetical protein
MIKSSKVVKIRVWGCRSVAEPLPRMCETLDLIPSIEGKAAEERQK